MTHKRFVLAMASVAVVAAITASNAMAGTTTGGEWYVNGSTLKGNESVSCEIGEHNGEKKIILTGQTGENHIGTNLTATGVKCSNATIFNDEAEHAGTDSGELEFTGVTVSEPEHCAVEGGVIKTNPLHTELYMDSENPLITFDKFEPAVAGTNIANIKITGATCAIAGTRVVKGVFYGQGNNTETPEVRQPLTFSPEIDETAGSALLFAGNSARLKGQWINFLSGANAGKTFEARAK